MKVGYVLKVFPRLSETFILNEILALEAQGVEVEIFSLNPPNDGRYHGSLARLKADITYVPRETSEAWRAVRSVCAADALDESAAGAAFLDALRQKDGDGLRLFLQSLWLAAAVQKRGIEHLHAHFATSATAAAMTAHLLSGVSFSFTAHAKDIYHQDLDEQFVADALERASFVVTVTDYNVGRLAEFTPAARRKVRRLYNGVPLDRLVAAPETDDGVPSIVSVGRLVEKKGFPYLVEACKLLKDRGRPFTCSILGGGPEERNLRQQIQRLGLEDCVSLAGAQPQENVIEAIRGSRLMALPCIVGEDGNRDALPTVLLEAMALGRPVVSTDLEGVTEIVDHGRTGLLVPQRDSAALAEAMDRLLADAALRREFGCNARRKAERLFSLDNNVAWLAAWYEEAVNRRALAAAAPGELGRCA